MSVKTDTENKKGALVFGQLPQTSAQEAAELEASCLKEAWSKKRGKTRWKIKMRGMRARGWMAGWSAAADCGSPLRMRTSATLRWIRPSDGRESVNSCFFFDGKRQKRGVKNFTLEVRRSNEAAIGLYHKLGFLDEGVRPNFYDSPKEDALILWKKQETQG